MLPQYVNAKAAFSAMNVINKGNDMKSVIS